MHKSQKANETRSRAAGSTWWGQRWIEALEHGSRDVVTRLGKGRVYARDGHVHGLKITAGKVVALVSDDDLDSYQVSLQLEVFSPQAWQQILQAMSEQALFVGQLLNGEMPREIDRLFHSCGKSLFPTSLHDMDADCSCEDWSSPCKHVAATHYVLGEALDRDPFLLFELRGRSKEQVLSGLSHLRSGHAPDQFLHGREGLPAWQNAMSLSDLSVENFERQPQSLNIGSFDFDALPVPGTLLRSLGKPASWTLTESPQELLAPLVAQARQMAIELASEINPDLQRWNVSLPDKKARVKKSGLRHRQVQQSGSKQSEHEAGE